MLIKLDIEHNWVEEGKNGRIVRRVMTLDEAVELLCEICISEDGSHELTIDKETIVVCKDCAKEIINEKLDDPEFYGNIEIITF